MNVQPTDSRRTVIENSTSLPAMKTMVRHWQQYFAQDGMLSAWIVVKRSVYETLLKQGELTVPQDLADPDFTVAYAWLRKQMQQLGLVPPHDGLTPWWCWIRREPDHPMPYREDLGQSNTLVLLKLRLPASRVILSCFYLWHWALNGWCIHDSLTEEHAFDRLKAGGQALAIDTWMQASWARVFDLDRNLGEPEPASQRSIQGCFWQLHACDVVEVIEQAALDSHGYAD